MGCIVKILKFIVILSIIGMIAGAIVDLISYVNLHLIVNLHSDIIIEIILGSSIFFVIWIVGSWIKKLPERKIARSGIAQIDQMDGNEFEHYLAIAFKKKGFRVKITPYTGDYGVDLIISKGRQRIAIQAKRSNRKIGVRAVQEVVAGMRHYRCNKGRVVTNNYFTPKAKRLAYENNIELWDRDRLVNELSKIG